MRQNPRHGRQCAGGSRQAGERQVGTQKKSQEPESVSGRPYIIYMLLLACYPYVVPYIYVVMAIREEQQAGTGRRRYKMNHKQQAAAGRRHGRHPKAGGRLWQRCGRENPAEAVSLTAAAAGRRQAGKRKETQQRPMAEQERSAAVCRQQRHMEAAGGRKIHSRQRQTR